MLRLKISVNYGTYAEIVTQTLSFKTKVGFCAQIHRTKPKVFVHKLCLKLATISCSAYFTSKSLHQFLVILTLSANAGINFVIFWYLHGNSCQNCKQKVFRTKASPLCSVKIKSRLKCVKNAKHLEYLKGIRRGVQKIKIKMENKMLNINENSQKLCNKKNLTGMLAF